MRPLLLSSQILVPADPGSVWSVLCDVASWPLWCGPVQSVTPPPQLVVGARLAYVLRLGPGVPVRFDVTIDELVPGKRLGWSSTKWWGVRGTRRFVLSGEVFGTRIEDQKTFESQVWPVAVAYPRATVMRMSEAWLLDLKAEVSRRRSVEVVDASPDR